MTAKLASQAWSGSKNQSSFPGQRPFCTKAKVRARWDGDELVSFKLRIRTRDDGTASAFRLYTLGNDRYKRVYTLDDVAATEVRLPE